jgi:hypothetical protein
MMSSPRLVQNAIRISNGTVTGIIYLRQTHRRFGANMNAASHVKLCVEKLDKIRMVRVGEEYDGEDEEKEEPPSDTR